MGAEQSSQRSAAQADAPLQKTCYYELLSCERTATDDELKKAYRRKALELHPDRNFNDVENATRKFAEVQTAYEVLSDPQERAWYDSYRDDILRGNTSGGGDEAAADAGPRYFNNVKLTPAEDLYTLMGRFNRSVPFDDSPYGFYGILESTFAQLALEEEAAFSWDATRNASDQLPTYHAFGSADESYNDVAKHFYKDWSNFATVKSFSWKDKYRLSDAPDRQVRRMMEKDNKKAREQGIRDFNDAVRSLVAFVRKRDPRCIQNNMQTEAERQQALRDSANAQAARQRAANQEKRRQAMQEQAAYVEPGTRPEDIEAQVRRAEVSEEEDVSGDELLEEIECMVCDKTFKSEKQFEAHERSRKHLKAVQTIRWQMRKEDKAMGFGEFAVKEEAPPALVVETAPTELEEEEEEEEEEESDDEFAARMAKLSLKKQKKKKKQMKQAGFYGQESEEEEEEQQEETAEAAETAEKLEETTEEKPEEKEENEEKDSGPSAKAGKAKLRREKKAAMQAAAAAAAGENEGSVACTMCRETFASNTKLHQHLRDEHATKSKGKGKKKR